MLNFQLFNENYNFLEVTFIILDDFRVLLLILITFWSILVLFGGFVKIGKSKAADPRWPPFENMT